jgi:hypothetical protein
VTISQAERSKMLAVRLCGPRVLARLESIGVERLSDLAGRAAEDLVAEVNIEAGRAIWHPPMATEAMSNLIAAAEAQRNKSRSRRRRSSALRSSATVLPG